MSVLAHMSEMTQDHRIPITHEEEELSRAYVKLVASRAGITLFESKVEYGLDGIFKPVYRVRTVRKKINKKTGENLGLSAPYSTVDTSVEYQIKATYTWTTTDDLVKFQLESDDYDRLTDREGRAKPILLILFCLPRPEENNWLHVDEDRLLLRKCCYFTYLDADKTTNKSKKTVSLPRKNILTPSALRVLLSLPPLEALIEN